MTASGRLDSGTCSGTPYFLLAPCSPIGYLRNAAPEQRRLETRRRRILVDEPANEHVLRGGVRHAGRRFQSVIDAKQNRGTLFDTERGGRAERGRVRDIRHGRRIIDAWRCAGRSKSPSNGAIDEAVLGHSGAGNEPNKPRAHDS